MISKITIGVLGLLLAVVASTNIKSCINSKKLESKNNELNSKLMEKDLSLGKAHTQFEDAEKYIDELNDKLRKSLDENKELVRAFGKLKAELNTQGSGTGEVSLPDVTEVVVSEELKFVPNSFYLSKDTYTLNLLGPEIPFRWQDHRLRVIGAVMSNPLAVEFDYALALKLEGQLVQTTTESGAVNHYINLWEVDEQGKRLNELTLTEFEVVYTDEREEKFFPWAPHLDIGVLGGYHGDGFKGGGSFGISLMGYGKTENDLDWRFIRFGFTIAQKPGIDFVPVLWNLGGPIPLVSNLWIGPALTWSPLNYWGGALMINLGI